MLPRVLETEVMDSAAEARDYDSMDHRQVNERFVSDFLSLNPSPGSVLDVGTGTAQIPIELCRRHPEARVVAVDLAEHMLRVAQDNLQRAGFGERIRLEMCDAKRLSFADRSFDAVMSNSIVHHSPRPQRVLSEMRRVCRHGGTLFVRDLLRPADEPTLDQLVNIYAAGANDHQRRMFADSLRAALTLDELRQIIAELGYPPETATQTSDRHWTWAAERL